MADQHTVGTLASLVEAPEAEMLKALRAARVPCEAGLYPLIPSLRAYSASLRAQSVDSQDARLKAAKADAAEMALARQRGGLVPFTEVEKVIRSLTGIMYTAIDLIGDEDDRQRVAEHFAEHLGAVAGIGTRSEEPRSGNAGDEARADKAPEVG